METFFFEIFENIPRQGPGDNRLTQQAFSYIKNLPEEPDIIDIGCGKGVQTIELARLTNGRITAIDNHQFFLDYLEKEAKSLLLNEKITCINVDMNNLPFMEQSFDLIWSEGSIFVMGIKNGLRNWMKFVKKGGYIVFSDLVWLSNSNSEKLTNYWNNEYPDMLKIDEVIIECHTLGLEVVSNFQLPKECWIKNYLNPMEKIIYELKTTNSDNSIAMDIYKRCENENDIVRKYYGSFAYVYFILKNS